MTITVERTDTHAQLRELYRMLLTRQDRFDEFKHLLQLYVVTPEELDHEPEEATRVRVLLNQRIGAWLGGAVDLLSPAQVLQWRAIVVEERLNISVAPWKESNGY